MDPLIVLFGVGVGIMVGTTGVGGGSLMTPALILVFNTKPTVAIGTDLVLTLVAGALLVTGIAVLARALFLKNSEDVESVTFGRREKIVAVSFGLSVGFVLGLTSAGSGSLIAVGLILLFRLAPRRIVGTDVFHAAILLWAASIAHVVSGNVDFGLAGNILVGSIPGVWVGSGLAVRLPEGALRPTLGVVLVAAGLALLQKGGLDFPIALIFAIPAALAAAAGAVHFTRQRVAVEGVR